MEKRKISTSEVVPEIQWDKKWDCEEDCEDVEILAQNDYICSYVLQAKVDGEPRAIKVFENDYSSERLLDEASLAAGVQHPNCVKVHATSESVSGRKALIMDVWNSPLTTTIKRLNAQQRASVAFQLADGLSAIHKSGVLHCDIKSDNALIKIVDNVVYACWADFGCAMKGFGMSASVKGTDEYMAPELYCLIKEADAKIKYDVPVDVYAFGVVLAELLSGEMSARHFDKPETFLAKHFESNNFMFDKCTEKYVFAQPQDKKFATQMLEVIKIMLSANPDERRDVIDVMCKWRANPL